MSNWKKITHQSAFKYIEEHPTLRTAWNAKYLWQATKSLCVMYTRLWFHWRKRTNWHFHFCKWWNAMWKNVRSYKIPQGYKYYSCSNQTLSYWDFSKRINSNNNAAAKCFYCKLLCMPLSLSKSIRSTHQQLKLQIETRRELNEFGGTFTDSSNIARNDG